MTERERLAELIRSATIWGYDTPDAIAEWLLDEGVICPPCKVGDVVYVIPNQKDVAIPTSVEWVLDDGDDITIGAGVYRFNPEDLGRGVFFAREEAEAAMAERRKA